MDGLTQPTQDVPRLQRRRLERWCLVALTLFALAATLHFAGPLFIPILSAVLLSLLLRPVVLTLLRLRVPETLAAAFVVIGLIAAVASLSSYLFEPAQRLIHMAPSELRTLERKLQQLAQPVTTLRGATDKVSRLAEAAGPLETPQGQAVVVQGKERASWFTTVRNMLASIVSAVVLLYFLLASGDVFLRKLVRVLPGLRDRILAVEISRSIQADIGRYFATTTLINLGLGFLTATAMWLLSMPSPLLLGTIAAVLNFLPYIGSAMTLVAIVLVAAISFDTFWQIALPPLTYLALTAIEGQLVQPMLLGQRLSLSPVVLFVWMMIWGWLWGVAGLILAVPMLVALKICADRLDALSAVAEFIKR